MWLLIDAGISVWLPLNVSCLHKISEEKIMATNFRQAKGLASWKIVQNKARVELDSDEKTMDTSFQELLHLFLWPKMHNLKGNWELYQSLSV